MASLSNLATPTDVIEDKTDHVGYTPLESGLYKMAIKLAFLKKSPSGALGLNMYYEDADGNNMREVLWVESGDAKGNRNYYVNGKGEKRLLPGMQIANAVAELAIGHTISELDTEEKVVSLYDSNIQAERPTTVQMISDLLNSEVILGVKHNIVDRNVKNDAGVYVPSGETRDENIVDKVFSAVNGMTIAEQEGGNVEAIAITKWESKWKGVTSDKSTKVAAAAQAPGAAVAPQVATKPLFPQAI